jgi:transaldolase
MYVTGLVAPNTVNTLPQGTLNALYEYSGQLADTVSQSYPDATDVMSGLADLGISISKVLTELETAGVKAFVDAWTDLLTAVESN